MDNYSHRMVPEVFETFWSGIAVAGPGLTAVKTVRGVGQHFGDQIEVASRVSCPPARRGRGLTCLGRKGEDRMHFTFFYDGAAERTAEYPTLEEAVRSIELGQVDRTLWSIQYMDREDGIQVYRFPANRDNSNEK